MGVCHRCGDVIVFEKGGTTRSARHADVERISIRERDYVLAAMMRRPN
jgi:hypothetical protein